MVLYYVKISIIFYCFILCKNLHSFLLFFWLCIRLFNIFSLSSFCLLCSHLNILFCAVLNSFSKKQLRNTGLTAYRQNISQIIQHTQFGNFTFFIVKSNMKQKQIFIIRKKITIKVNRHSLQESIPERALCPTYFFQSKAALQGGHWPLAAVQTQKTTTLEADRRKVELLGRYSTRVHRGGLPAPTAIPFSTSMVFLVTFRPSLEATSPPCWSSSSGLWITQ